MVKREGERSAPARVGAAVGVGGGGGRPMVGVVWGGGGGGGIP